MTSNYSIIRRKKMIEVAIPLAEINKASSREKAVRHGHPSTLHLWWARRPLAAARAVIFCQMVDDPSSVPEEFPTALSQQKERRRLFSLINEIIEWKKINNLDLLKLANKEIYKSWKRFCDDNKNHPNSAELFDKEKLPDFHDPFAGGGSLPLEAQKLGLKSYASDLNPVAVLLNKAMIEVPPLISGIQPVNPRYREDRKLIPQKCSGTQGYIEDLKYYGEWVRNKAEEKIGNLYPNVEITSEIIKSRPDLSSYLGRKLKPIAWIWARTVKSPNPAFSDVDVPLISTYLLCSKNGQEVYIQPRIHHKEYKFFIKTGKPENLEEVKRGTKLSRGANFECLLSNTPIKPDYIKSEGRSNRIGKRLIAIVLQASNKRIYIDPIEEHVDIDRSVGLIESQNIDLPNDPRNFWTKAYGLSSFEDLFTSRQHLALSTFSQVIDEAVEQSKLDAESTFSAVGKYNNEQIKEKSNQYSKSIAIGLSLGIGRCSDYWNSLCTWQHKGEFITHMFTRQAIPMTWDFAEASPFSEASGNWSGMLSWPIKFYEKHIVISKGYSVQAGAQEQQISENKIISTDPPYYDNICYADLSDFFYIWLRKTLKSLYPTLFATLTTPKSDELVASPYRHKNKENAELFFLEGMTRSMTNLASQAHVGYPITIYYAFKQSESKQKEGLSSTGWETFLEAILKSGLAIKGTWPIRTELASRMISIGTNALASSIVLVCSKQSINAPTISRSDFRRELRNRLPEALEKLEIANIAPVDLAQAAIGPGMAIFTQAKAVLNSDDSSMSIREALIEINRALDENLSKDDNDLDNDSRFAITFYESFGYQQRPYGDAEVLAKARNVSVEGIVKAGIMQAVGGKANLIKRQNFIVDWQPSKDDRLSTWEATQHLIKRLESGGEASAADLLFELNQLIEHNNLPSNCRSLAYRMYNHCEKNNQAEEARSYNGLIVAWPELERIVTKKDSEFMAQPKLI